MTVLHKKEGNNGMFFIEVDNEIVAEMTYIMPAGDQMCVEHTEIDENLRGRNIGFQLVQAGVEYARTHKLKIIPLCPFTKSVIDKKPEFHDVLAQEK